MKVPVTTAFLGAIALWAAPVQAQSTTQAPSMAQACTEQNLSIGVKMAQSSFYRQFHNQDLAQALTDLRRAAQNDMARGDMAACGLKATTLQAMLANPAEARVTLAAYQSQAAAQSGQAVHSSLSVADGRTISQQELMGMPLRSLNGDILGVITGVTASPNGQPLYITATPTEAVQATTPVGSLTVPVGLLLVNDTTRNMYVALSTADFWREPRFRDNTGIQPAGN